MILSNKICKMCCIMLFEFYNFCIKLFKQSTWLTRLTLVLVLRIFAQLRVNIKYTRRLISIYSVCIIFHKEINIYLFIFIYSVCISFHKEISIYLLIPIYKICIIFHKKINIYLSSLQYFSQV